MRATSKRPRGRRAEDRVLGDVVLAGRLGDVERLARRDELQQRRLRSSSPSPVADDVTSTGHRRAARATRPAPRRRVLRRHEVGLRERQDARQRGQLAASCAASSASIVRVVVDRVRPVERREVEHVHEHAAALDVGEEVVAEAGAARRALDQPGDVGDHDLALLGLDRAEDRLERRERVVGDLRLRARHARDQRRLAGVRQPDEAGVGQQLEPQLDHPLLPRQPALGQPRRLARRPGEALVAAPAEAALGDADLLAGRDEVEARAVPALDLVPGGTPTTSGVAVGAVAQRALAVPAAAGAEVRRALEELQVAQVVVAAQDHVAAAAAVAAVGTALGDVRLAAERHGAVAARATAHLDPGLVRQHVGGHGYPGAPPWPTTPSSSSPAPAAASAPQTARRAAEAGYRLVLAARSEDKLAGAGRGGRRRTRRPLRRDRVGRPAGDGARPRSTPSAASTSCSPTPGSARRAASSKSDVDHWKAMVLTNVYGAALTVRATIERLQESKGHLLLTGSVAGRRALPGTSTRARSGR